MADQYRTRLTDKQRETLRPIFDKVELASAELSRTLTEMGLDESEGDHCFFCTCTSFVGGGSGKFSICARQSCRHTRIAHWT